MTNGNAIESQKEGTEGCWRDQRRVKADQDMMRGDERSGSSHTTPQGRPARGHDQNRRAADVKSGANSNFRKSTVPSSASGTQQFLFESKGLASDFALSCNERKMCSSNNSDGSKGSYETAKNKY
uniref:Uncharacterized protein n=1 Tax=Pristionchus pacificus TaxID=54126 RepID=A0A2A6C018_PRIPA|eukprot:PDM71446.1 hypothetical protein PRIPAC_37853 [Pristionchus pacificus]